MFVSMRPLLDVLNSSTRFTAQNVSFNVTIPIHYCYQQIEHREKCIYGAIAIAAAFETDDPQFESQHYVPQ